MNKVLSTICLLTTCAIICDAPKKKLTEYGYSVYSQFGEDGIIDEIMNRIQPTSKTCIEFGAHNGLLCANTANLWRNQGWKAVLIEPSKELLGLLKKNTEGYDTIIVPEFVEPSGAQSLDNIIQRVAPNTEIDLLSVDIDGNDYHIVKSLSEIRPKVILTEFNAAIPAELDMYQEYEFQNFGCSVGALKRVAEEKGYFLAGLTDINAIFIANEYKHLFDDIEMSLSEIKSDKYVTYLVHDMIGRPMAFGGHAFYRNGFKRYGRGSANVYYNEKLNDKRILVESLTFQGDDTP